MMHKPATPSALPWYRQRWPWLLMLGPMVVVVAGISTAVLAVKTEDTLVNDDYYKRGKEINIELTRDNAAARLKMGAQVMFGDGGHNVRIMLQSPVETAPAKLRLWMLHPTLSQRDQDVELNKTGEGFYSGTMQLPTAAHWFVRLEDLSGRWRLQSEWRPNEDNVVVLSSQPTLPMASQ